MMDGNFFRGRVEAVGVAKQHESSQDGHEGKRRGPGFVSNASDPPEQLHASDPKGEDSIDFMLKNLMIAARERLNETQRADRPCFVIAPDKEKQARDYQRGRKHEPGPP